MNKKEIVVDATLDNLAMVQTFIETELERVECSLKLLLQISLAVEEIYVNIVHYAYPEGAVGSAVVTCAIDENEERIQICFTDSGVPYNPLMKEDVDITLTAQERQVGGLGIFMVKKSMDGLSYIYKDGKNILTIEKALSK